MMNITEVSGAVLVNADCLEYLKTLPDNHIDLILTDPPYFKVKPDGWDNQWNGDEDYLKWLDECLEQFRRVLKPAGSIYLFCGHRLAPDIEILMRERFRVLNHIIWAKPNGYWNKCRKEDFRSYFPATERILFAEHRQGPCSGKSDGYEKACSDLKQNIMSPLINYFRSARSALGVSAKQIAEATGKKNMASHWFGLSQWSLPNEADYTKLQQLFRDVALQQKGEKGLDIPHATLNEDWSGLNRQYSELVEEYKAMRRYFAVTASVPYTDVWTHSPVQFYPGKHPCEKPAAMLEDIIRASSRSGELVADFFMGSGSTVKAALSLGRRAIGVELETDRFLNTVEEVFDSSPGEITSRVTN